MYQCLFFLFLHPPNWLNQPFSSPPSHPPTPLQMALPPFPSPSPSLPPPHPFPSSLCSIKKEDHKAPICLLYYFFSFAFDHPPPPTHPILVNIRHPCIRFLSPHTHLLHRPKTRRTEKPTFFKEAKNGASRREGSGREKEVGGGERADLGVGGVRGGNQKGGRGRGTYSVRRRKKTTNNNSKSTGLRCVCVCGVCVGGTRAMKLGTKQTLREYEVCVGGRGGCGGRECVFAFVCLNRTRESRERECQCGCRRGGVFFCE